MAAPPSDPHGWLMLVTDRQLLDPGHRLVDVVVRAVAGGVDVVQVREKDLPDPQLARMVRAILEAVSGRAAVVVNGRPDVAFATGAGLHLSEAMAEALGDAGPAGTPWPLWGQSVHTPEAAARAAVRRPHYLVAGPAYPTGSKPQARPLGPEGLQAIVRAAGPVPVLAIGGVTPERVAALRAVGVAGVAVRSFILTAPDPCAAARALRRSLS